MSLPLPYFHSVHKLYIVHMHIKSTSLSKLHYAQHFSHSFHQITHTAAQKPDIKGLHHAAVMSSTKHQVFINPLNTFHHAVHNQPVIISSNSRKRKPLLLPSSFHAWISGLSQRWQGRLLLLSENSVNLLLLHEELRSAISLCFWTVHTNKNSQRIVGCSSDPRDIKGNGNTVLTQENRSVEKIRICLVSEVPQTNLNSEHSCTPTKSSNTLLLPLLIPGRVIQ